METYKKNLRSGKTKYRVFKVSINIVFFYQSFNSKIYEKKGRFSLVYPIFLYSLTTIALGFWGKHALSSLEALHTNFTGGEDFTHEINELHHDPLTNQVWNNLSRATSEKINRNTVEVLLDLQEKYMDNNKDLYSDNNVFFLLNELKRKGYRDITKIDMLDFFDSLNIVFSKK
jgi:hypothetical protein